MNTPSLKEIVHGDVSGIMQLIVTQECQPKPDYMESIVPREKERRKGLDVSLPFWTTNVFGEIQKEIRKAKCVDARAKEGYKDLKTFAGDRSLTFAHTLGETRALFAALAKSFENIFTSENRASLCHTNARGQFAVDRAELAHEVMREARHSCAPFAKSNRQGGRYQGALLVGKYSLCCLSRSTIWPRIHIRWKKRMPKHF